jgi:hypothetical protein
LFNTNTLRLSARTTGGVERKIYGKPNFDKKVACPKARVHQKSFPLYHTLFPRKLKNYEKLGLKK